MHFNFTWSSQVCHISAFCILEVGVWIMSRTWHLFMKMPSLLQSYPSSPFFILILSPNIFLSPSWSDFDNQHGSLFMVVSRLRACWNILIIICKSERSWNSKGNIHKFLLFRNRLMRWTNLYLWLAEAETHPYFWLLLNEINLPLWFFWAEKSLQSLHADAILCLL